jgi:Leucine-rich repeat (LRR) protein
MFFLVYLFSFQIQATCHPPQLSCPDNLALIVPSQVTESDPPFQAIVCIASPYSQTIEIQLISSDRSEIKCPQTAEMPRNYTWIAIDMTVADDFIVDGPIQLTLSANFSGQTVTTQMTVLDNDQKTNNIQEQQALKDLFTQTNGPDWKNKSQWLESNNPCTWHGIQCDNGVMPISEIQLNTHNLLGQLPSSLNQLADLKRLYLGHNSLSGGFSDQLYQTRLNVLWLQNNAFSGSLSSHISQMIFLQDLNISNNQFSGYLPDNIGNLSRLESLDLSSNQFTGPLPQSFDQFNRLTHLNLHDNQLSGSITVIARLCQLKELDIRTNQFTGKLHDLTDLPNIRTLDLGCNNFENEFPALLAQNTRILRIDVHDTHLRGPLPQWEAYDYALYALNLRSNKFIGKIPDTMLRLTNLSSGNLDLRWNALYAETQAVKDFIDQKHIGKDWEMTQTIAPENLSATVLSGDSVRFDWTPIDTDTIAGAYELFYDYVSDGTFRKIAETTDKTDASYTLTHLNSSNTYYFKIRTRTDPHANNRNIVYSEFSSSLSVTTQSIIETMAGANGQISPSGIVSAPPDTAIVIHFVPDENYHVENVLVDQISVGSVTSYTFSNVNYDHKIQAVFSNDAPQIAFIPPVTFDEDVPPDPIPLTIIDRETPTDNLLIRVVSDNLELVPQDHIQITGIGSAKYLHLQNAQEMSGIGIITIKVTDPLGLDANRAFTYTVTTINDPPVASNHVYKVYEDQEIEAMFTALDIEQDSLTYYVTAAPRHGKLTHDAGKESFNYRGDTNYSGRDYIRYKVQDSSKLGPEMSNEAVIVLEIMPVNDPPVSNAGKDFHVLEGTKTMLNGSKSYDVDDTVLTFEWRQSKGPEVTFSSSTAISPVFIAPHAIADNQPISLVFWLKVFDDDNKYSEDNCIVWVDPRDPPIVPIAQMGMPLTPVAGRAPFRVDIEDQSIGKIDSWQWFFGDGHHSLRQHPVYTYDNPGIYTLKLEITGTGGSDTITYTNWITVLANPNAVSSLIPKEERTVLIDLFNQTQGTQWIWHTNWLDQYKNEYYWYGVTVPKNNVTRLALPENALDGDLPDNLNQLTQLQSIDLSKNQITGPLPDNISQLNKLTFLDISGNQLVDTLSGEISQLDKLTHMALACNQFYGSIPQSIGNMQQLQYLNFGRNKLIGKVPVTFANLIHLTTMNISYNQLNGMLPDFIDQMTSLRQVDLSHNQFMGTIPDSFMRATYLEEIRLSANQLDGAIPDGFNEFDHLQILDLSNNQFLGAIPKSLYETTPLTQLNLSNNLLENHLTSRITLLKNLMALDISHNQLNGIFPVELTRLDQLQILKLSHNLFSGTIPDLSRLSLLRTLDISHNYFKDVFPERLFALQQIKAINLSGNNFSGEIPDEIMQMDWLEDNASDFRWNRLTVNNTKVEKFLASKQVSNESWINTQTIAPTGLKSVEGNTWKDLVLSWTPIPYTSNNGGYEIYYATHPDGPYERRYVTTSKLDSSYTFTNLLINETYYFKLRTVTYAHINNPNTLTSDYTPILPVTIFQLTERPDNPKNLEAEAYYNNRVMLSWKTILNPENVYYRVFRSETIDGRYQCISLPLIMASFVDWDVREGTDYYYKIRSYLGETPSVLFSNTVHAIPGTPSTYSIKGHYTVALVSQGDTAIYSMTLEGASGFKGKIDMDCLWPGNDPTTPPAGISPMFYLSGFVMDTDLSRIPLPAPIQLKVKVAQDYTPSVLIFQLAVTDSQTKNQRIFYMQLHVIPKEECAIALSSDRPVYHEYAPIGVSGLISSLMPKEPVDIQLLFQEKIISQKRVKTLSDGFFETFFLPMPWMSGIYTIQATWDIWDVDDIFCPQGQYSVSLPVVVEQSTCHIQLSMKPDQQVPKINQSIDIMGEMSPAVDNTELTIRIFSPDQTYVERTIPLSGQHDFEIQDIPLTQPGIWQIKAYFPGNELYPGCESNPLEILVEMPPGRAILLGTRFPQYQRQLPQNTLNICKHVYDLLLERGFDSVEICALMHTLKNDPLTPDPPLEGMEWVDYINPTSQDFLDVLTNEFSDVLNPHMPLWIFIHGFAESDASFIMRNDYDRLSASQINAALDSLQELTQCPINIILDMPYSGSFLPLLAGTNRVIMSSSAKANYRVDPANDLSFSTNLFHHLQTGNNLFQAFQKSKHVWDCVSSVSAQIDDNGDGIYSATDGALARQIFINGATIQTDLPVISGVEVQPQLQYATSLPISVSVTAGTFPISNVKVKLFDPSPTPLFKDISTVIEDVSYTLYSDNQPGLYHNILTCLTEPGVYTLLVIVRDRNLCKSDPVSVTVIVAPDTPVSYFDSVPEQTRHTLDALCGFFTSDDPNFHQVETPTDRSIRAIWGLNYRHVIAVGDNGTILFFDGNQWEFVESHTQQRLLAVWGTSSDNVYATGEEGVMRHFNGEMWETIETNIKNPLCGIWGTSPDNIYAVGGHGTILHYDGTSWQRQYTNWYDRLNCIWGRNASDIYAAGDNGLVLHYDGSRWDAMPFCSSRSVDFVFGDSDLVFGGRFFDPIHFEAGQGWTPTQICQYREINTFWQSNLEYVFSAGERGQVFIWSTPATCRESNTPPTISPISDREIMIYQPVPPIPFTVKDNEHFPYELRLDVMTSNPALLPSNRIVVEGTAADRLILLEPIYGIIGEAYISIVVSDPCERKQAQGFMLKVTDSRSPNITNDSIEMKDILDVLRKQAHQE